MSSWTIGLSRRAKAQPTRLLFHQTTRASIDSSWGIDSQQIVPGCIRVIDSAEKPESERSWTTVWKPLVPEGRSIAGIDSRVRGAQRSSWAAIA